MNVRYSLANAYNSAPRSWLLYAVVRLQLLQAMCHKLTNSSLAH